MEQTNDKALNLRLVIDKIKSNKRTYFKVLPIVFVLTCAYMLCLPRNYTSTARLAPELGTDAMSNGLSDFASSLGFGTGTNMGGDAISPLLYPDLMEDNGFVASLYNIRVTGSLADDEGNVIDTTYYAYMKYLQKKPFWAGAIEAVKGLFCSSDDEAASASASPDPYKVSMKESGLMKEVRSNIIITIDKETAVITISATAQDPQVARIMADSVKSRLQEYITAYRTGKARVDLEYYRTLRDNAWLQYDSVCTVYGSHYDANRELIMRSASLQLEKIERDMQVKYTTYSSLENQYQTALAKVQERTPAFVTLKGAEVPVLPSSPRRTFNVICMMFLATIGTTAWIIRRELIDALLS